MRAKPTARRRSARRGVQRSRAWRRVWRSRAGRRRPRHGQQTRVNLNNTSLHENVTCLVACSMAASSRSVRVHRWCVTVVVAHASPRAVAVRASSHTLPFPHAVASSTTCPIRSSLSTSRWAAGGSQCSVRMRTSRCGPCVRARHTANYASRAPSIRPSAASSSVRARQARTRAASSRAGCTGW